MRCHEITEQGEGLDHTIVDGDAAFDDVDELAHYFRFEELRQGRRFPRHRYAADRPHRRRPSRWTGAPCSRCTRIPGAPTTSPIRRSTGRWSASTGSTRACSASCNGHSPGSPQVLREGASTMYELRYQAEALMRIPSPLHDGRDVRAAVRVRRGRRSGVDLDATSRRFRAPSTAASVQPRDQAPGPAPHTPRTPDIARR